MKLHPLTAALAMAGLTAAATQVQAQGPVPELLIPEQSGFVALESVLSAFAALIEAGPGGCTAFTFANGVGFYGFKVETEDDPPNFTGYATLDLLRIDVARTATSNKGHLWGASGGGTIAGRAVANYAGSYGFDLDGSILYGNADMEIHGDLWDEHIIKDFWDVSTGPSVKEVADDGLEVITKQRYPKTKWAQSSEFRRDNGQDGNLMWIKTQIAPDGANLGTMVITATTDSFGGGFETFGGLVTLTCL